MVASDKAIQPYDWVACQLMYNSQNMFLFLLGSAICLALTSMPTAANTEVMCCGHWQLASERLCFQNWSNELRSPAIRVRPPGYQVMCVKACITYISLSCWNNPILDWISTQLLLESTVLPLRHDPVALLHALHINLSSPSPSPHLLGQSGSPAKRTSMLII